jgi:hypothetical protein
MIDLEDVPLVGRGYTSIGRVFAFAGSEEHISRAVCSDDLEKEVSHALSEYEDLRGAVPRNVLGKVELLYGIVPSYLQPSIISGIRTGTWNLLTRGENYLPIAQQIAKNAPLYPFAQEIRSTIADFQKLSRPTPTLEEVQGQCMPV